MGTSWLMTPETLQRLDQAIGACSTVNDACLYAGITSKRFFEWQARGRAYDEHLEAGGEIIDGEDDYRRMFLAIQEARARARLRASTGLADLMGAKTPPSTRFAAIKFYLQATDPEHWGRRQIALSIESDASVPTGGVTDLEMELAASLEPYLAEVRRRQPRPVIDVASRVLPAGGDESGDTGGGVAVGVRVHRVGHRPSRQRAPRPVG